LTPEYNFGNWQRKEASSNSGEGDDGRKPPASTSLQNMAVAIPLLSLNPVGLVALGGGLAAYYLLRDLRLPRFRPRGEEKDFIFPMSNSCAVWSYSSHLSPLIPY